MTGSMPTHKLHEAKQIFASHVAIVAAISIFCFSLVAGLLSDSIALLLDAAMGLIFLLVAFFVRFIIKRVNQPADHLFNFGYEKYEPLAAVIQNVAIVTACVVAVKFAIQDIIHPEDITRYDIPAVASSLAGMIAMLMALYLRKVSVATRSSVLKTASAQWLADSVLSFGMLLGFLFGIAARALGYEHIAPYVDPAMAVILALVLIKLPIKSITQNLWELLDAAPNQNVQQAIRKIIDRHKGRSIEIYRLRFRKAGKKIFLEACFLVDGNLTIREAQTLVAAVEKDILSEIPECDMIVYCKHE